MEVKMRRLTIIILGIIILHMNYRISKLESTPAISYETTLEVKKENVKDEKEGKYPITEDERELITRIVAAESRGEPLRGK